MIPNEKSDIPEDIRRKSVEVFYRLAARAEATKESGEAFWSSESTPEIIAEALMAERETQQKRAADILSAVADILAKRMTDLATPELLEALSAAIRSDNAGKP